MESPPHRLTFFGSASGYRPTYFANPNYFSAIEAVTPLSFLSIPGVGTSVVSNAAARPFYFGAHSDLKSPQIIQRPVCQAHLCRAG